MRVGGGGGGGREPEIIFVSHKVPGEEGEGPFFFCQIWLFKTKKKKKKKKELATLLS